MVAQYFNTDTVTNAADTPTVVLFNGDTLFVTDDASIVARGSGQSDAIRTNFTGIVQTSMVLNGDVYSASAYGINVYGGSTTISIGEESSISSGSSSAIYFDPFVTGKIRNAGEIVGDPTAISATNLNLSNSGSIQSNNLALALEGSNFVRNSADGVISGLVGVQFRTAGSQTLINNGSIDGSAYGVQATDTGSLINISNNGVIVGASGGILVNGEANSDFATIRIVNTGRIASLDNGAAAIETSQGSATIVNSGLIVGDIRLNGSFGSVYDGTHGVISGKVFGQFSAGDTLIGGEATDRFYADGGSDSLVGNGGVDTLDGGSGLDTMEGGDGNDRYFVDETGDIVIEDVGDGYDRVFTTSDYRLAAVEEIEVLRGVVVSIPALAAFDVTGLQLAGNEYGNRIFGVDANDSLNGDEGDDTLNGGAGGDLMRGGEGNDRYFVDDAADQVREVVGDGTDRVLTSVSYTLGAGQQIEVLRTIDSSGFAALTLTGNAFANVILGNDGSNTLFGLAGADTLKGYDGDDIYSVDNAADVVREAAGDGYDTISTSVSYALETGQEIEKLRAISATTSKTALTLTGNEYANVLQGNIGVNTLAGGLGSDTLTGYAGSDVFRFDTALAGNVDTITDFVDHTGVAANVDKIHLENALFMTLGAGALSAAAFTTAAPVNANQRIIYNTTTGALSYDDDGNGARAAVQFAILTGSPDTLNHLDFLIV